MRKNSVTRCICHGRSFEEVKEFAAEQNISSVEELQDRNFCSNSCQLCTPYVEIVLKTGQLEFTPGEPFRS